MVAALAHRHDVVNGGRAWMNLGISLSVCDFQQSLIAAQLALISIAFVDGSHRESNMLDAVIPSTLSVVASIPLFRQAVCHPSGSFFA
jgi:hypothetical protein